VRSVSNTTRPGPLAAAAASWKPSATTTGAGAVCTTCSCSTARAAVAGRTPIPAIRNSSTSSFSGSLLARSSTGRNRSPSSEVRATPGSSRRRLLQSGV
jgi:hypothetical protein